MGGISDINAELSKLMVMNDPQKHIAALSLIWGKCAQVQSLMGQIPVSHPEILELEKFTARVGEFCRACMVSVAGGKVLTDEQKSQLADIAKTSEVVLASLNQLQAAGGPDFTGFAVCDAECDGAARGDLS